MTPFEAPSAKSRRYARELKQKKKSNGKKLTKSTACYRMGYLNARRDRSIANKAYQKKRYKSNNR